MYKRQLGDIDLSTINLFGSNQEQELIVRVPISTATLFLAHRLPEFSRDHPDISIRLVSNIWAESAGRENVDVELRLGIGEWNDAPVRKISEERIVPITAKSNDQLNISTLDLLQGPQVQILGFQDMWQRYLSTFDVPYSTATSFITVDTTIAAVDIVAAGGGCAVVLDRFAKTAIETRRSVKIVGDAVPIQQSHFLVGGALSKPNDAAKKTFEIWVEQIFA